MLPKCYRCGNRPCACRDGITIYHADCREVLPLLEKKSINAVISDPPYGIGYQHNGTGNGEHSRRNSIAIVGDNAPFDPMLWLTFPKVLLWGADHFCTNLPSDRGTWIAWDKAVDERAPADTFVDVEFAWTSERVKRNAFRMLWKGIACEKAGEENGRRWHPTQKPLRLMRWCLNIASIPGDCILDPYCGSGTTLRAAKDLGRRAIGIEIEERYCEIAANRLRQGVLAL